MYNRMLRSNFSTCFACGNESGRAGETATDSADCNDVKLVLGKRIEILHRVVVGLESNNFRKIGERRQLRLVLDDELNSLTRRTVVVPANVHRRGSDLRDAHVRRSIRKFYQVDVPSQKQRALMHQVQVEKKRVDNL